MVYSTPKKGDILKSAGKLMDLVNIMLSKITKTKKDNIICTHSKVTFRHKAKKTSLKFIILGNLDNKENPKRDIYGSNLHGN